MTKACYFALPLLFACVATPADETELGDTEGTDDELAQGTKVNGGSTGAMVRQVTPAGYDCIESTITVPEYLTRDNPVPWIYYGFEDGNEDVEVGLAFQQGDGSSAKPRRYLPYVRQHSTFWFGAESTRIMPGETVRLGAQLGEGSVQVTADGAPLTLAKKGGAGATTIRIQPLDTSASRVRRVVGLAQDERRYGPYRGSVLPALGPVRFAGTSVCKHGGGRVAFQGNVASWQEERGGVQYGTSFWPENKVSRSGGVEGETVWLFPPQDGHITAACTGKAYRCGGHGNAGDRGWLYQCNAGGTALYPKQQCGSECRTGSTDACR